jgi:hypothetical protein
MTPTAQRLETVVEAKAVPGSLYPAKSRTQKADFPSRLLRRTNVHSLNRFRKTDTMAGIVEVHFGLFGSFAVIT